MLEYICCPECRGELELLEKELELSGSNSDIVNGLLTCGRCGLFPIINAIPRLLPKKYLPDYLFAFYPEWLEKCKLNNYTVNKSSEEINTVKTLLSFSFEWSTYNTNYDFWQKEFNIFTRPWNNKQFTGKVIADFGCGMGRYTSVACRRGGEIIAMDLSNAIESAYNNCKEFNNFHAVQGDICNPPVKEKILDMYYSLGVLHHIPQGAQYGLKSLLPLLKFKGEMLVWLYGTTRGDKRFHPGKLGRSLIKKLPLKLINVFSWMYAILVYLFFKIPAHLLTVVGLSKIAGKIPFPTWRKYSLKAIACNVFDIYATPVEYGYNKEEIEQMMKEAGYCNIKVEAVDTSFRERASWIGIGNRQPI